MYKFPSSKHLIIFWLIWLNCMTWFIVFDYLSWWTIIDVSKGIFIIFLKCSRTFMKMSTYFIVFDGVEVIRFNLFNHLFNLGFTGLGQCWRLFFRDNVTLSKILFDIWCLLWITFEGELHFLHFFFPRLLQQMCTHIHGCKWLEFDIFVEEIKIDLKWVVKGWKNKMIEVLKII
jgi:hypothetical protein